MADFARCLPDLDCASVFQKGRGLPDLAVMLWGAAAVPDQGWQAF